MPKGRGRKGCAPSRKPRKMIAVSSRKSFADLLKEQTTNLPSKESLTDECTNDSSSGQETDTDTQHVQSTSRGVLAITGNEQSLDAYCGSVQLTSSSSMGT